MGQPVSRAQFARQWAGKATSIAIAMVAPGVVGITADKQLNTTPGLSIAGFVAGFAYGLWKLIALAQAAPQIGIQKDDPVDATNDPVQAPSKPDQDRG